MTDTLALSRTSTGVRLPLRVIPRSPRTRLDGVRDGRLVLRVTAPPVAGAANDAVIAALAEALDRPRRAVRVVAGESARNKLVEIDGVSPAQVLALLAPLSTG